MRHLIDPLDLTQQEITQLLDLADRICADPAAYQTTLKRPYAPCPKINRKNYEENRKKVLTMVESVVL